MHPSLAQKQALSLDSADPLVHYRSHFYIPKGVLYLDGNSLGLLSREAEASVHTLLEEWKAHAINGWFEKGWLHYAEEMASLMAPLLGAKPEEVMATGSTTVNLHQLLATLYDPTAERGCILTEPCAFPSTAYALQSHLRLHRKDPKTHLRMVPFLSEHCLDESQIIACMTDEIQIVILSSILYKSGQLLDIPRLTQEAHRRGILIGFDCAHSVGSIPHQFDTWGVDFAFWCHYKHLNAGPGAVGGLFLNERHFGRTPGLAGWFGNRRETQFEMGLEFEPEWGAGGLQIGTPHLLSLAPLRGSLALFQEAGIDAIRAKSLALTTFLRELFADIPEIENITPLEDSRRGGHISYRHPNAKQITAQLKERGVVIDFRPPNLLRFAPVALYNTFQECYETAQILKDLLHS